MNSTPARLLLWASWFLASVILCSLLRIGIDLFANKTLTANLAQSFASVAIGIIALILTQEIVQVYGENPIQKR